MEKLAEKPAQIKNSKSIAPPPKKGRKPRVEANPDFAAGLTRFLNNVGKHDLLGAAEERELMVELAAGREAARELAERAPFADEAHQLKAIAARGKKAGAILIERNLRLVVFFAKRYRQFGLELDDLIQEGYFGLVRAVESIDPKFGTRFSTYASFWIRRRLQQAVWSRGPIRVPGAVPNTGKSSPDDAQDGGNDAGANEAGPDSQEPSWSRSVSKPLGKKTVTWVSPLSLEAHVPGTEVTLLEVLSERGSDRMPDQVAARIDVRRALQALGIRERRVVALRHGLDDGQPRTYQEVGEALGLCAERARQLESKALGQLKQNLAVREGACA